MSEYYCHECAALSGWMNVQNPDDLTGTDYQLDKFIKHTVPSTYYSGAVSVFQNPEYSAYSTYVGNTAGSGCLVIDDFGRKNLIWVAGSTTGFTFENGFYRRPEDAVKVVLYDNQWKIHAYPTNSDSVDTKRCKNCGRLIVT